MNSSLAIAIPCPPPVQTAVQPVQPGLSVNQQAPLSGLNQKPQIIQAAPAPKVATATVLPVIPLMSKEEGQRLISQMPKRSLQEALEMMEKVLGRPMPLVEDETLR